MLYTETRFVVAFLDSQPIQAHSCSSSIAPSSAAVEHRSPESGMQPLKHIPTEDYAQGRSARERYMIVGDGGMGM